MKELFWGIVFIVIVGFGGLFYQNIVEHPARPIACPLDAKLCPDGTSIGRTGNACSFAECPAPNVTFADIGVSFAVPAGFTPIDIPGASSVVAYALSGSDLPNISIRRYAIVASSTALATIQQTAIGGASGLPAPTTAFTSTVLGMHRFTVVSLERFEGVITTAYYLARVNDVLRFEAIDRDADWMNPSLDVSALPAHAALLKLLTTLQGQG